MWACEPDTITEDPLPRYGASQATDVIDNNFTEIDRNLDLIRDGMIDLHDDDELTSAIRDLAIEYDSEDSGDYYVPVYHLNDSVSGFYSLIDSMKKSLQNHGGSSRDADTLEMVADSFQLDEVMFYPIIYIPFMDDSSFVNEGWNERTPSFLTTQYSEVSGSLEVKTQNGSLDTLSETLASDEPIWIVTFKRIGSDDNGDPVPDKFWARCWCELKAMEQPPRKVCVVGHHAWGRCGRTGLFNDDCSKDCGDGPIGDPTE